MIRKTVTVLAVAGVLVGVTAAAAFAAPNRGRADAAAGDRSCTAVEATAPASAALAEDLQFMREEEKVARDVYLALAEEWDARVFSAIARSEQRHMDAVGRLLDAYGVDDPAAATGPGEFVDPDLQALYDELVERGRESLEAALEVGALIEEVDIADLIDALDDTDEAMVERVFGRLLSGSENHLRAFVRNLEAIGVDYSPAVLDASLFADIVG
jgi:hypothetical protein